MFSYLLAAGMFRVADLMTVAPDWFVDVQFDTAPDLLVEHVEIDFISKNKILHPVVDREFFKKPWPNAWWIARAWRNRAENLIP